MRQPSFLRNAAILVLTAVVGCQSDGLLKLSGNKFRKADADNPAVRALCIWQPAKGRGLDDLPARGFAGQVFFFTRGKPTSVQVEGDVRIYLFDQIGTSEKQSKPIHQFDFVDGAWNAHLQDTQFGPAYQVFIPYTRDTHRKVNCSLRLRLIPEQGPTIYSDMAHVTLPGAEPSSDSGENLTSTPNAKRATASRTKAVSAPEADRTRQQLVRRIEQTALKQLRRGSPNSNNQHAHNISDAPEITPARRSAPSSTDHPGDSDSRGFRRFKLQRLNTAAANDHGRASQTTREEQPRHPLAERSEEDYTARRETPADRNESRAKWSKPHPLRSADEAESGGRHHERSTSFREEQGFRSYSIALPR